MHKIQLKKIAFALSLGAAVSAHAAGLGTITSSSKLGEPLNAEIELLAVTPAELTSIQAALASEQVYQDQMLEKPAAYPFIKIEVSNNTKGQPVLKLSSSQPITEAFLDMLIQVDWPTGRLVKEYTLLLDPPGFNSNYAAEAAATPVAKQSAAKQPAAQATQETDSRPADTPTAKSQPAAKPVAKKTAPKMPVPENTTEAQTLTTERGDTLYAIARQMKPDNVSMDQMLTALYQSNQDAFDGKNMNRLKVGKIIRLPDQAALERLGRKQAQQVVAEHTANWLAYKNTLGKVVKESAPVQTGGNTQQSAGKIGSAGDKPLPQSKPTKDVLKLSAGDEKSTALSDKANGKAAATAAQEDATAKANAIKEEQSRAAALEKQVADMKKLVEMKSNAMAQAEKNAVQAESAPNADQQGKPAAEPVKPEAAKDAEKASPDKVAPSNTESPKPVAENKPAAENKPEANPVEPAATQPSFMHVLLARLKAINPVLPYALIALPVLLCIWALIRIRRKKQIDNFEDVIVTSPATEMQNNTVFGDTQAAASGDTSFLTDFSQSGVGGMIDSHDVDPIAEAEVYMAYGRDAQAEEILKDAIQKDPERQELKVKLLEIYQAAANKAAFESLASDLYAKLGPADSTWAKVSAMGQKLDPENSLYQVSAEPVSAADESNIAAARSAESPVPAENEEGYHFNFEAPALEFESANAAVSAEADSEEDGKNVEEAVLETETASDRPAKSGADEPLAFESTRLADDNLSIVPETPAKNDALTLEDTPLSFSAAADAAPAPALAGVDRAQIAAAEEVAAEPDTLSLTADEVNADPELTPKSLDLPSLNLDDAEQAAAPFAAPAASLTGEPALSNEDAVFESLPELSLELGGPNDAAQPDDEDLSLEDLDLDAPVASLNEPVAAEPATPETEFPEISLDVSEAASVSADEPVDEPEEVNTKLDLIQAYIDMEDVIGAKELIEEVMAEGGERQRQRARELLDKIA
ncbi:FimV/HubP family polar landmark protein [Methylophilus sp. 3sh_L]|uniref:FimV/HubP family polar landmark protein n=1 Tax=Methylophilus sp. 3sh_L TaxID=3377114 RepID=UPI00398EAD7F